MFAPNALIDEMEKLRKFALRLTRNPHNAEDLLQATLLRALEKKHLFESDTNLFRWTSKIMFNLFVSDYRRKTKFETKYDPEAYLAKQSVPPVQDLKVELTQINNAMSLLSKDHKEILVLVCVHSMSYESVATTLGIPVGTVRSRLARARESLQEILDTPENMGKAIMPYMHNTNATRLASWR